MTPQQLITALRKLAQMQRVGYRLTYTYVGENYLRRNYPQFQHIYNINQQLALAI